MSNKQKYCCFITHELHNVKKKKKNMNTRGQGVYGHDTPLNSMLIMAEFYFKPNKPWNGWNKFPENRPETNYVNKTHARNKS